MTDLPPESEQPETDPGPERPPWEGLTGALLLVVPLAGLAAVGALYVYADYGTPPLGSPKAHLLNLTMKASALLAVACVIGNWFHYRRTRMTIDIFSRIAAYAWILAALMVMARRFSSASRETRMTMNLPDQNLPPAGRRPSSGWRALAVLLLVIPILGTAAHVAMFAWMAQDDVIAYYKDLRSYKSAGMLAMFAGAGIIYVLSLKYRKEMGPRMSVAVRAACFAWVASIALIIPGIFVKLRALLE